MKISKNQILLTFQFNVIGVDYIQFLSDLSALMQLPVAPAVMNDGSWCFKALLHLAVHLVSTAHFSLGPFVFLLWITGSKNSKHAGYWQTVGETTASWCFFPQIYTSHTSTGHRCFNVSDHCFISHSIFYIYHVCVGMCVHACADAWPCMLARVICHTMCWYGAVSWPCDSYCVNRSV